MASMFIDEDTNEPFLQLDHTEMVRGLIYSAWQSIGVSLSTLASGETRDSLTALEEVAVVYGTCRTELWKLQDHLKDCPDTITNAPTIKAALDICRHFDDVLKVDDLNLNRPDSQDDPRILFFIKAAILWVDLLMRALEQKNGRKARQATRAFTRAVAEVAEEHDHDEATTPTQSQPQA